MSIETQVRLILGLIAVVMEEGACDPLPALPAPPGVTTAAGDLCRLIVRLNYLVALLACEANAPDPEICCDDARETERRAHTACPD